MRLSKISFAFQIAIMAIALTTSIDNAQAQCAACGEGAMLGSAGCVGCGLGGIGRGALLSRASGAVHGAIAAPIATLYSHGIGGYPQDFVNCECGGSYKHPVPPQYTYHWPGRYAQQAMTDYHSPWRFPPLKPYYDEPSPGEAKYFQGEGEDYSADETNEAEEPAPVRKSSRSTTKKTAKRVR